MSNEETQDANASNCGFDGFRKRSGLVVPFRREKITSAVQRAIEAVARNLEVSPCEELAGRIADRVVEHLSRPGSEYFVFPDEQNRRVPNIEDVQDLVEKGRRNQRCGGLQEVPEAT